MNLHISQFHTTPTFSIFWPQIQIENLMSLQTEIISTGSAKIGGNCVSFGLVMSSQLGGGGYFVHTNFQYSNSHLSFENKPSLLRHLSL